MKKSVILLMAVVCVAYSADDIAAVFREVQASGLAAGKNEFETTAQYEARLGAWKGGGKKYVFIVDQDDRPGGNYTFRYDADTGEMHMEVWFYDAISAIRSKVIRLRRDENVLGQYTAENNFGVTRTVTRVAQNDYYVELFSSVLNDGSPGMENKTQPHLYEPPLFNTNRTKFTWSMDVTAAMASKGVLRIALVGTIFSPEITNYTDTRNPTIEYPFETTKYTQILPFNLVQLRVIDSQTGMTIAAFPPQ